MTVTVRPVRGSADRRRFVDHAWAVYADDPNWVPPLKSEVHGLIDPAKNPWFEHAEAEFFLALRDDRVVGRISAQVDRLVEEHMGRGTGQWGFLEANDAEAASALIAAAEAWLREVVTSPVEIARHIIPDGREGVAATLRRLAEGEGADLILVTGGTGPAPRDETPEALADVIEKELPGFGEEMRRASLAEGVPTAILSRQTAGIRDACDTLPGP